MCCWCTPNLCHFTLNCENKNIIQRCTVFVIKAKKQICYIMMMSLNCHIQLSAEKIRQGGSY